MAGQKFRVFTPFLWESRNQSAACGDSELPGLQVKKTEAQIKGFPQGHAAGTGMPTCMPLADQVPVTLQVQNARQALSGEGIWPRSHGKERTASVCGVLPTPRPEMRELRPCSLRATPAKYPCASPLPPSLPPPQVCAQDHCACGFAHQLISQQLGVCRQPGPVCVCGGGPGAQGSGLDAALPQVAGASGTPGTQAGTDWSDPWQEPRPGARQPLPRPAAITSSRCNH